MNSQTEQEVEQMLVSARSGGRESLGQLLELHRGYLLLLTRIHRLKRGRHE